MFNTAIVQISVFIIRIICMNYCQLLVDQKGRICLPYREWNDASVMKECGEPAVHWLDNDYGRRHVIYLRGTF